MTYLQHIKNLIYGFIHGYFLDNTLLQYILLIIVKLVLIFFVLKKPNIKKKKIFIILTITYFIVGIIIDLLCILSKHNLRKKLRNYLPKNTEVFFLFLNEVHPSFVAKTIPNFLNRYPNAASRESYKGNFGHWV